MKIILAFLLTSIVLHASAQPNWKEMGLKGKVKSLNTAETYRYKKNGMNFTPWEKTYNKTYLFDNAGYFIEFEERKADGSSGYGIKYNNKLKEKKIEQSFFDKEGKPTITKTLVLDAKGRKIEQIEYTRDGKLDRSYIYTYDEKGNMTSMTGKRADGTITSITSYTYNDRNQKTDQIVQTPGYANSYYNYRYDAKGNMIEESWLNGRKEVTFRFERTYDDKGNKITESKYKDGNIFLDKSTWTYEYDKQGNWTKKTQFTASGEDFSVEERVISYY